MSDIKLVKPSQLKAEQQAEEAVEKFAKLIEKYNVYFLSEPNKYAVQNSLGVWTYLAVDAFYKQHLIHSPDDKRTFDMVLSHMNRMKRAAVNSFRAPDDDVLNVISREKWLQPTPGQVDPIFEVLLNSLSGGRKYVREHIEKVFVYKYLHPETYTLPCITISGEGGAGKNEFIDKVMKTVFGEHQVESLGTTEAFGQFNGRMLGKTVIYIDEALVDRTDANAMKRKVGNKTMDVNVKFGLQGSFDNTPWYWLGGNGTNGAVMLAGDTTDRRYSVLTVTNNIMHWVGQQIGVDVSQGVLPGSHPCVRWYNDNEWKLEDKAHVSRWLNAMVEQWGSQEHAPSALHDEDYTAVRKAQKSVFEDVMESVFHDPAFTHIKGETLYDVFKLKTSKDSPAVRSVKNKVAFLQDVERWLVAESAPVEYVGRNYKAGLTQKKTSAMFFVAIGKGVRTFVNDNSDEYTTVNDRGVPQLVDRGMPHVVMPFDPLDMIEDEVRPKRMPKF